MQSMLSFPTETQWPILAGREPKVALAINSGPYSEHCQIEAQNDLEAIQCWLQRHKTNLNTFNAYCREAKRLLLWCIYEKGASLTQLKVQDFEHYFEFLKNPPSYWCGGKDPDAESGWRPFQGSLGEAAFRMSTRVINSLMNYLVEADYLRTNPIKLLNKTVTFNLEPEIQKYKVWERMLETDEWAAVQQALQEMPERDLPEIDNKMRTQFLFALLYLLGLRIHEVALSSWNAFRQRNGSWWFFIKGKGGRLGHVPVNEQLLSYIKAYRLHLERPPLPSLDETTALIISKKTGRALKVRQLYGLVKAVGIIAANAFEDQPLKKKKLKQLSPHWLRHLSASHQDRAGIPATVIQANHRHRSSQTTQIYLHAEDELRATEIEKLKMALEPKLLTQKNIVSDIVLKLSLKGNPVCGRLNLAKLLSAIENGIFKGMNWARKEYDTETFLNRYEQLRKYGSSIEFSYLLTGLKGNELEGIELAITREASIRLFECLIIQERTSLEEKGQT